MRRVSSWLAATLSTILFLATPLLYAVTAGQGSGQQTLSDRKLTHYEDNGHDVLQTLNRAADRLRVPLGVELDGSLPKEPVSIEVSNGTIDDVFSAIVEHAPGYMWVEQDGVVNVIPKVNSANPILNLRINTFQIHNATPNEAAETIRSLPEVKAWLAQNHVTERSPVAPSMLAGGGVPVHGDISLELHDITLRKLMNTVVKKGRLHGWTLARYGADNGYLNIQIG